MPKPKLKDEPWKNRITGAGELPADQFLAHPLNPRRHPGEQRDALRGSLDSVGWIAPVIVSARSGMLLDGHARVEEALSRNDSQLIPFIQVDVSEDEERLILAVFDPITDLATLNRDALDALLNSIHTDDAGLQSLLNNLASSVGLVEGDDPNAIWKGLPEFENNDSVFRSIMVHFDDQAAVDDFARKINQTITEKAKYIWHPYKGQDRAKYAVLDKTDSPYES